MWHERTSHLTHLGPTGGMGREGEKKGKKKKRELEREKLYLLSKFPDDRIGGFRQSKRESSSSRQVLCIKTRIREFRQTLRGRGFSSTLLNPCLRVIRMVMVLGPEWPCNSVLKIWD